MGEKKTGAKSLALMLYTLFVITALITATTGPPAAAASLSDISPDDPNSMYINYLVNKGIISGYPDGSFHPTEGLSRAQAAVVLARAKGLTPTSLSGKMFNDVEKDHWAGGYIASCVQAGYLKGYPDGSFKPEEKLSRAQGISLVLRLSQQDMTKAILPTLTDVTPEYWAAPQIATGLAANMIGLSSDQKHYLPEQPITREELSRALATLLTSDPEQYKTTLIGKIKPESGETYLTRQGQKQKLEKETELQVKDIIESQADSTAVINYPDGSSVLIKENTHIEIKETQGRNYIKKDGSPGIAVDFLNIDIKKGKIFTALATPGTKTEKEQARKE
ncbi:MAG: S-layer homology domain-containing protein, partial [Syntrophomonas sp.]